MSHTAHQHRLKVSAIRNRVGLAQSPAQGLSWARESAPSEEEGPSSSGLQPKLDVIVLEAVPVDAGAASFVYEALLKGSSVCSEDVGRQ